MTVVVGLAMLGLSACGDDDASGGGASLEDQVRASVGAENAGDADAFLDLWTDDGLAEYDSGTREEIASGESENFGISRLNLIEVGEAEIDGDEGRVVVDATVEEDPKPFVQTVFRVAFKGIRTGETWKLNGFEFVGSPPPSDEAEVVAVTAVEYAFQLDRTTVPAGEVGFRFVNEGEEPHEITLYRASGEVSADEATAALGEVDGGDFSGLPDGYEVAHIGFAEPGQPASDISFSEDLKAGNYVLTCYIPQGSTGDEGEGDGIPHIQLGMLSLLTVE